MIVVRVELHSAQTREITELARLKICNAGGTNERRDYDVTVFRGRAKTVLDRGEVQRRGRVARFPSLRLHVWNLVFAALAAAGYKGDA